MTGSLNPDPDLKKTLTFIRNMADDQDLELIRAELVKRQRALSASRASEMGAAIAVGKKVRLVDNVKPKYLGGQVCEVMTIEPGKVGLKLSRPTGMFRTGTLRAPLSLTALLL